jgi:hypothetical protein
MNTRSVAECFARLTLASALSISTSFACDLCSVYVSERAQGTTPNTFIGGVSEQYTHFGTIREDGTKVDNDAGQYLNSSNTQVFFANQISPELGVQLNIPVLHRTFLRATDTGTEEGKESGMGDVSLLGRYTVLDRDFETGTLHANLIGGVKLPTGSTSRLREELSETEPAPGQTASGIHGHDLTLGSGSYDFVAGATAQYTVNRFVLPASIQYAYRTRGRYAYRFANDFAWQLAPGYYAILDHARSGIVALSASGELKGEDDFDGGAAEDTGMKSIYVGPQFTYTAGESLSLGAAIEFPVLSKNTAFQIVTDSRIRLSVTARL